MRAYCVPDADDASHTQSPGASNWGRWQSTYKPMQVTTVASLTNERCRIKLFTPNPKPKNLNCAGILPGISLGEWEMRRVNLRLYQTPRVGISGVLQSSLWLHTLFCNTASYFTCYSVKEKAVTSNARGKVGCIRQCQWEAIHQLPVWAVLQQCLNDHELRAAAC